MSNLKQKGGFTMWKIFITKKQAMKAVQRNPITLRDVPD
jgi:hypothetical protein